MKRGEEGWKEVRQTPKMKKLKMNERCSGAAVLSSRRRVVWAHLAHD